MSKQFAVGFLFSVYLGVIITHLAQMIALQLQIPGLLFELVAITFIAVGVMTLVHQWVNGGSH